MRTEGVENLPDAVEGRPGDGALWVITGIHYKVNDDGTEGRVLSWFLSYGAAYCLNNIGRTTFRVYKCNSI